MQKNQVIIFSPSVIIRKGLQSIIEKIQNTIIVAQIDSLDELKETAVKTDCDYIIIDTQLTNESKEIDLILRSHFESFKTIWLTNTKQTQIKNSDCIISLNQTQNKILDTLQKLFGNSSKSQNESITPDGISKREADILKYIAMGYSNKEVADKLYISAHTVVTHRKNITRKLGIKTAPGLTIYAILNKIIDVNDTEKI